MSSVKEPHFFAFKDRYRNGSETHNQLFDHGSSQESFFGESSTMYAVWEPAQLRLLQSLQEPKIILMLREPLERLLSHYRWMFALGLENLSLLDALKAEKSAPILPELSRKGCYPWYYRHSNYSYFCELIKSLFGEDRVMFLRAKDLRAHPQQVLDECFRFLGLDPIVIKESIERNRTSEKTVQREFGLDRLLKPIPPAWRNTFDPNRKVRDRVKRLFGEKKRIAPNPTLSELESIRELLDEDVLYYNSLWEGN